MIKVGITEIDIAYEDKETARSRCLDVMGIAQENGVELLVFPEMTLSGFTMSPELMGESYHNGEIPESISFFMKNSCRYDMAMAFGYIEKSQGYENKLAVVDRDNLIMDYSKIHPFSMSGEDRVYKAGDKLCQSVVKDIRLGGYICYDLRFPEIFSAARDKYDAILVIANWPEQRVSQWEALLRARAIENQAYVIGVNRIGRGNDQNYVPSSHVFDCYGNEIAKRVSDNLLVAELDREMIGNARRDFPQGQDRRISLYKDFL